MTPNAVALDAGDLHLELRPDLGGCMAGLWWRDVPVLRSTPAEALTSVRDSASYPLVPFSNRVARAELQWQGTSHPLVRHVAQEPHAIHGVGWQRPWTVLEQAPGFVMLSLEHQADTAWPFAFDASQSMRLTPGALEMTLAITNQASRSAPVGLGWHPYFPKRSRSRISFEATGRWEMGDDKLPTHCTPARGLDADCAFLDVDHCFEGWTGVAHLRDEQLHVRLESDLRRLVVFTHDRRGDIAIEPVSHVNNAMNAADPAGRGVCVLEPGQTLTATCTLAIDPVH